MRRRLTAIGVAALVAGAVALAGYLVLRDRIESNWSNSLAQLQAALGPGASVTYGSLAIGAFTSSGTVEGLSISAPNHTTPFSVTVEELVADGLASEGGDGFRIDDASARGLVVATPYGTLRAERAEAEDLVVDDSVMRGPIAWSRRIALRSAEFGLLSYEPTAVYPPAGEPTAGADTGGDAPAEAGGAAAAAAAPKLEVAELSLDALDSGLLDSLRFERLTLAGPEGLAGDVARGGLRRLDLTLLASGLAGRLMPARVVLEALRLEEASLRDPERRVRVASLDMEVRPDSGELRQELTVEGLHFELPEPVFAGFWEPIREAGYPAGFRVELRTRTAGTGQFEVETLRAELPEAAWLEATALLDGLKPLDLVGAPDLVVPALLRSRLGAASLTLVDEGGLDTLLEGPAAAQGMTARQLRQVAAFRVAEALRQGQLPRDFGVAVQEFLTDPGRLVVRAQPGQPVPLIALGMLVLTPERTAESLGLSARNQPAD